MFYTLKSKTNSPVQEISHQLRLEMVEDSLYSVYINILPPPPLAYNLTSKHNFAIEIVEDRLRVL